MIIDYEVVDKIKLEIADNFPLILIWFCSVPVLKQFIFKCCHIITLKRLLHRTQNDTILTVIKPSCVAVILCKILLAFFIKKKNVVEIKA